MVNNPIDRPAVSCEMIIERGDTILMGKRGNVFGQGSWALPGGHLEPNEGIEDCVRRELFEETGITPRVMELIGVVNDIADIPGQAKHYVRFVYVIKEFSGEIVNKEPDRCEGWEWKNKDNLPTPLFVGHIKTLKLYSSGESWFLDS